MFRYYDSILRGFLNRKKAGKLIPDAPEDKWPYYEELEDFYGVPGVKKLIKVASPYPLKLAWAPQTVIHQFSIHPKLNKVVSQVLSEVLDHYGRDGVTELGLDLFGGCFNNRKMRGGSKLSTHAYAAAMDWHPAMNRFKWDDKRAVFAKPEYDKWWEIWERAGAVSLGRQQNRDWMHVQFVRLGKKP